MDDDETETLLQDCENRDSKLRGSERNLIQSFREQYDAKGYLTARQLEVLNEIWDRVT